MNSINNVLQFFIRVIDQLNEWIGRSVAWLTFLMVVITFTIVVLRYAFDLGWIAMQESVFYLHALVFMLGIAFTLKHDGHVRVDIFFQRLNRRWRGWVDLLGTLTLLIPVCLYILVSSWDYVTTSWTINEGSREAGGLPGLYLIKSSIIVMGVLLLLQGIAQALKAINTIAGNTPKA